MKAVLAWWVSRPDNLPEWFEYHKEMEITPEQIIELYNTGNNVMLWHGDDQIIIFVDDKKFSQR
jgi:hypothetical protein